MMNKSKHLKTWLILSVFLLLPVSAGYVIARQTVIDMMYGEPTVIAKRMQYEMQEHGMSPNGALEVGFGDNQTTPDLSAADIASTPDDFRFGIVKESSKDYITGTFTQNNVVPSPPQPFLDKSLSQGTNTSIWELNGKKLAISSVAYHYGDVTGNVIVGQPAQPYLKKLQTLFLPYLVVWVASALLSGLYLLITSKKAK